MAHQASDPQIRLKLLLALGLAVTVFVETYRFEPNEFYNTFSGAHKPVPFGSSLATISLIPSSMPA